MSGRAGYRKTGRKVAHRRRPHEMPDYRLSFMLPAQIAFAVMAGDTGFVGVTVETTGRVVVTGKNRDWVLKQAGDFVASIAKGRDATMRAVLERSNDEASASGSPAQGGYKATRDMVVVSGPSVVFLSPVNKPLVFPVRR